MEDLSKELAEAVAKLQEVNKRFRKVMPTILRLSDTVEELFQLSDMRHFHKMRSGEITYSRPHNLKRTLKRIGIKKQK